MMTSMHRAMEQGGMTKGSQHCHMMGELADNQGVAPRYLKSMDEHLSSTI